MKHPEGTVTLLFTDIEGSTKLWEAFPEPMQLALARHDALLQAVIGEANGYVFKTIGDAFCAAFADATDALKAALTAQLALISEPWPERTPLKVRMALHTGVVKSRGGDYFGQPLNRVARLLSTGHGGQVLLSAATQELVRDSLPTGTTLHSLGEHRLKDLGQPESVFQLCHPGLPSEFLPLRSLDNPKLRHNLPQQVTSFVGREQQIDKVKGLLLKTRLLTLTGSGGCGKTRLALQVAADLLDSEGDGAWLVELAPLTDPSLVPATVAGVLSLKEEPGKPITQSLVERLKDKHLLLVLDNCEHLLDVCAKLIDTLLRNCPQIRILATSREGLGIAGETTYRVPSLSLPDPTQMQTPESLTHYEAARLFIERAVQAQTSFVVTSANASALASVCHRLDGIPLAIELAATRARSLSLEDINRKLDQRFRLLTGGSRTALPRQQTLRSLIDWSYDLLSEDEKALLCRLSVFAGGWTLEAAEGICSSDPVKDWEVLYLLTSLCDKSLVVAEPSGSNTRYQFLETIRQYARDRLLESGEAAIWRERHQAFFTRWAEAEPQLQGPAQQVWLERLETEHDNLRAALEGGGVFGLRLAGVLWWFWWVRGYFTEGRARLAQALGDSVAGEAVVRAKALNGAGTLAWSQGEYGAARALHEESLALYRALDNRDGMATALGNQGAVAFLQSDFGSARALYEESLTLCRELDNQVGIAYSLTNLGSVAWSQGNFAEAQALHEESLAIQRELGDRYGIANSLTGLGLIARDKDSVAEAWALHKESLAIRRELGNRVGIANSLNNLGNLATSQGDFTEAGALLAESLAIRRELDNRYGIVNSLEGIASVSAARGGPLRAARLWGAAEKRREAIGAPLPPTERERYEQQRATTRAALANNDAFDAAWAEGRALTLEQALTLAGEGATSGK